MKSLSIIIPAHNEEGFIEDTIKDIFHVVKNVNVIVVCNNCSDRTFDVVEKLRERNKNIININIKERIGKGGAILEGFKYAGTEYAGFIDADNAFYAEDILKLVNELGKYDCAIASKWLHFKFNEINEGFFKKILSRIWNLIVNLFFNLGIKDTQAGMKFFRKKVLDKIKNEKFICRNFDFDVEFLDKIKRNGFSIKEVGVKIKKIQKKSKFSYKNIVNMSVNMLKYWYLNRKKV